MSISKGTKGAVSELLVCADLLSRGFSVFRSTSQSCDCDLIAQKGNLLLRIEVTTSSTVYKNGSLGVTFKDRDQHKFDILAVNVVPKGIIVYLPTLPDTP